MGVKLRKLSRAAPRAHARSGAPTGQWLKSVVQGYFNYYAVPETSTVLAYSGIGNWALVETLRAGVRNAALLERMLALATDGSLDRASSILIPRIASPPVIHDRTGMR